MFYVAQISNFPNCIALKSLIMQKRHGKISMEAAFRTAIPIWEMPSERDIVREEPIFRDKLLRKFVKFGELWKISIVPIISSLQVSRKHKRKN